MRRKKIKRYLYLLALCLGTMCGQGWGQTRVEALANILPNTASGTLTFTFGTATTAGETIIAGACVNGGLDATTPVTDSASNTYTSIFISGNLNGTGFKCGLWRLTNAGSGITSVTLKETASAGNGRGFTAHYTGMATSTPDDGSSNLSGPTGTPWNSSSLTTTNASDLLLGIMWANWNGANCAATATGGWHANDTYQDGNGNGYQFSDQIVSVTSSYQDTGTDTGTCNHYAGIAALKASGGAAPAKPCTLTLLGVGSC